MTAIQRFKKALIQFQINPPTQIELFAGFENISDQSNKERKAAFFVQAIKNMDENLPEDLCHQIRDACACSKGGWRLKAMQKIARDHQQESLETKLAAIRLVTYMGNPVLLEDGTIFAGIGEEGGFACPCPVFDGVTTAEPVSKTYCYCCAGHFRFHYQIALGVKLRTTSVVSSALYSLRKEPCRFVYEICSE